MTRRSRNKLLLKEKNELEWSMDQADNAFWDEFWALEDKGDREETYTIIIRNEKTGKEQRIERVSLGVRRKQLATSE
jgi:hypothetical protein